MPYVKERFPWPMYGHDRWHTSQYGFELPDEPSVRVEDRNQSHALPATFALEQNYPNPFVLSQNATSHFTEIRFALPQAAQVQIRLFDILGAEVKTWAMMKPAGVHQFRWNGRDNRGQPLPSGVYFYRLEAASAAASVSLTKKLLLMRQR
ncbi:T9SS type A sorting domain-containing protein [candidate division KSB1 bacterium]|nr:T9SS type A sorting domain-containing protein [candidate division KSB1 bacterium]